MIDLKGLTHQISIQHKKPYVILAAFLLLIVVVSFIFGGESKNASRPNQKLTISAMGNLPPLDQAMADNKEIKSRVEKIIVFDEAYLFVNYRQVNGLIAEILFLWAGLSPADLQQKKGQEAIDYFLRYLYGLPKDEPLTNNPILGKNPWPRLFNQFKAELLMQGQGYKIYDGLAYYDSTRDRMVIEGTLSKKFMKGFSEFVKKQPANDRKRFVNNFLSFVESTKGIRNLSEEEKIMVRGLGKNA